MTSKQEWDDLMAEVNALEGEALSEEEINKVLPDGLTVEACTDQLGEQLLTLNNIIGPLISEMEKMQAAADALQQMIGSAVQLWMSSLGTSQQRMMMMMVDMGTDGFRLVMELLRRVEEDSDGA